MIPQLRSRESGFTLIEVTMAILILAGSLTIMIGLQAAIIERTVHDNNEKQAVMLARQILAVIEAEEGKGNPLSIQDTTDSVENLIESILGVDYELPERERFENFQSRLLVQYAGIPNVGEEALKRIDVSVNWSEAPQDQVEVTLFIPFDEDRDQSGGDDEEEEDEL